MILEYTLVITLAWGGATSVDIATKEACIKAANQVVNKSTGTIGVGCISKKTGDVYTIKNKKKTRKFFDPYF